MPTIHNLLDNNNQQELLELPVKLTDVQQAQLQARYNQLVLRKVNYSPKLGNEEEIRESIRALALVEGAMEVYEDLFNESINVEESEE